MKVVLDSGESLDVDAATFRKVLSFALHGLTTAKKAEGATFPKSEQQALNFIFKIQMKDTTLI